MTESGVVRPTAFASSAFCLSLFILSAACAPPLLGRRVDVGGHRLHVHTEGQGSPTVVFDSGMGDPLQVWSWVWPEVAAFTRVCVYDRAGLGRSDAGPEPRTSRRIARELHRLLSEAGVEGPYVLVGHSFGGLNLRLFAGLYPEDVAGLVMIDPTPLDYPDREQIFRSPEDRRRLATTLSLAPPALRQELDAVRRSVEEVRTAGPLPEIPVVVISAARPRESVEFRTSWLEMQRALVEGLAGARHVVADTSGHYVQFDQPELVVRTIRGLVEAARR